MIILCLWIIPITLLIIRLILCLIVRKYGKFSYDGFSAAGFSYHAEKDIFYSTKNAWQKNFGYTRYYDVFAPIFRMIIDTESIKFYYNEKNWLITFWKGQYGIVTGAEIGVYCTTQKKIDKNTIYLPVNELEMLDMSLILYKKGKVITKAKAKHWWLAVFKLAMFSNPKDLSMDINIHFPDKKMIEPFLESFQKLGYTSKDFIVIDNTFCFKYTKPHTRKVWTRTWITDSIQQFLNRKNVALYNKYLEDLIETNRIDDSKENGNKNLIMLNEFIPELLKNHPENQVNSKSIIEKIFVKKNIVLLDNHDFHDKKEDAL